LTIKALAEVAILYLNGVPYAALGSTFTEAVALVPGVNILTYNATNLLGLSSVSAMHVYYEASPPSVVTAYDNLTTNERPSNLTVNIADDYGFNLSGSALRVVASIMMPPAT